MSGVAVRMTCGACGAAVGPGDTVCPACGTALEFPARGGAAPSPGSSRARRERVRRDRSGGRRPVEPWMVVAGLALLALVVTIVVLQTPSPATRAVSGAAPLSPLAGAGGQDHIALLEQAVRDRPGDLDTLRALANALHDHRDWKRAIAVYQQYLQKNPGDPDARVDMGICYFELSQLKGEKADEYFAKAVSEMELALEKSPGHVPAAFNLGVIYLERSLLEESNEWFRRAVAIDMNHPLAQRAQRMLDQHSFGK